MRPAEAAQQFGSAAREVLARPAGDLLLRSPAAASDLSRSHRRKRAKSRALEMLRSTPCHRCPFFWFVTIGRGKAALAGVADVALNRKKWAVNRRKRGAIADRSLSAIDAAREPVESQWWWEMSCQSVRRSLCGCGVSVGRLGDGRDGRSEDVGGVLGQRRGGPSDRM